MREEFVTKSILSWLEDSGWTIISFDFPQSGTGRRLVPDSAASSNKNLGVIIPDVIASKGDCYLFLENKDHYSLADINKLEAIKFGRAYSISLKEIVPLNGQILIGVGFPNIPSIISQALIHEDLLDYVLGVDESGSVHVVRKPPPSGMVFGE